MGGKVLIAPWGNWFQYCRLRSLSTLPILISSIKPEKVIIFVLDTLANLQILKELRGDVDV